MEEFILKIQSAINSDRLMKITLSKPRLKKDELRNIFLRPIQLNDELYYQATFRYLTNDQVRNYKPTDLSEFVELTLQERFSIGDLFLSDSKLTILQSKKGKSKLISKKENHNIEVESHNQQKQRLIPESTPILQDLGISSSNGKVFGSAQDKFKQINKYIELIADLIKEDKSVNNIVDMGSGKGYLTFALSEYLSKIGLNSEVKGVEIRADLVEKCNAIATKNEMQGLSFDEGSIDDYDIGNADMTIALHACDIATDMAIAKGLESESKYIVVAPCCHKQIRKSMTHTDTVLNPLLHYGILKERQAEMVTDTIRALILQSKGYTVKVFEFISSEHTGKNVMITAVKNKSENDKFLTNVDAIKQEFGIDFHYLEKLI